MEKKKISFISGAQKTGRPLRMKLAVKDHVILFRMDTIQKYTDSKFWRDRGEKGSLLHCWWDCKLGLELWQKKCGD